MPQAPKVANVGIKLTHVIPAVLAVFLTGGTASADEKFELLDAELELVTAGTLITGDRVSGDKPLHFDFVKTTRSGKKVSGEGSLEILSALMSTTTNSIYLGDGAQGNLSSLININAINSQISVLLNLNINIDSSVGSLSQLNIHAAPPTTSPPSR